MDTNAPNTYYTYSYYYLPTFTHYDANDTVNLTVSGEFANQFMLFDKTMNKFIFHGLTIYSVGEYMITIKL